MNFYYNILWLPFVQGFFFSLMSRCYVGLIDNFIKLQDDKSYGTVTNIFIRIRRKKDPDSARYRALDIDDTQVLPRYVSRTSFQWNFSFSRLGQPVLILSEIGWNFLIFRVR